MGYGNIHNQETTILRLEFVIYRAELRFERDNRLPSLAITASEPQPISDIGSKLKRVAMKTLPGPWSNRHLPGMLAIIYRGAPAFYVVPQTQEPSESYTVTSCTSMQNPSAILEAFQKELLDCKQLSRCYRE